MELLLWGVVLTTATGFTRFVVFAFYAFMMVRGLPPERRALFGLHMLYAWSLDRRRQYPQRGASPTNLDEQGDPDPANSPGGPR